jgi:hypothetical protein
MEGIYYAGDQGWRFVPAAERLGNRDSCLPAYLFMGGS